MKNNILKIIAALLTASIWTIASGQESVWMQNGTTQTVEVFGCGVIIYDNGGPDGNYTNGFDGSITLTTTVGETITLSGQYSTESGYDYLSFTNGTTTIQSNISGSGTINLQSTTGILTITFHTDGSQTRPGFAFTATSTAPGPQCVGSIGNLVLDQISSSSARLSWDDTAEVAVVVDGVKTMIAGGEAELSGLQPKTFYEITVYHPDDSGIACCTKHITLRTSSVASHGCLDPTDLEGAYVIGYTGSTENPYATEEIVNYGPSDSYSRHTVHTSTTETDSRTNGQLKTVPDGAEASVRLGNWRTGAEAESIMYLLEVDNMVADLLILKYAAVLEDPNHTAVEQPRFRLELLNANMELIDQDCSFADFIANSNLGWNTVGGGSLLWKDWTTVGIDLTPYDGQTIYIRLTTYDCSQGGHYGYAYFTLQCSMKSVHSENCGVAASNTFTVPSGFNYKWYSDTVSRTTLSTSNSLTVTGTYDSTYYCQLSFVDNPGCNFTMSAYAGARWPLALFDTAALPMTCGYNMDFINRSTISADQETPIGSGEGCETAHWYFGDGGSSTAYNTQHTYTASGDYEVMLVSGIAGDACLDTARKTVHVVIPDLEAYITGPDDRCLGAAPDTLRLVGATESSWTNNTLIVSPTTTTTYTVDFTDSLGCAQTLSHTINVHPTYAHSATAKVCVTALPYHFCDSNITAAVGISTHTLAYESTYGCDSIYTLQLTVKDTTHGDTSAVACDGFVWRGHLLTASTDTLAKSGLNAAGCDSTTTLHLTVKYSTSATITDTIRSRQLPHTFNGHTYTSDVSNEEIVLSNSAGCDSTITYSLVVLWQDNVSVDSTICDSLLPFQWGPFVYEGAGVKVDSLINTYGADSIVTMRLHVNPTYDDTIQTTICEGMVATFGAHSYSAAGYYTDSLRSVEQCDSVVTMHLSVTEVPSVTIHTDTICRMEQYELTAETSAEYIRWSAVPSDAMLVGHENEQSVRVSPGATTIYIAYVDHSATPLCPQTDSISISRLHNIEAQLKAIPSLLHIDDLDYKAYDITRGKEQSRTWYIDGQRQLENDKSIARTASPEADSLVLMLAVDNGQCRDTAQMTIPIYNIGITAPNIFTPQRETNNRFMFGLNGVIEATVNIYDRSGRLVYTSADATTGWDGNDLDGKPCRQGDYVWKVVYRTEDYPQRKYSKVGTVALIK